MLNANLDWINGVQGNNVEKDSKAPASSERHLGTLCLVAMDPGWKVAIRLLGIVTRGGTCTLHFTD